MPRFSQLVNGNPLHIADPKDERYAFEKCLTEAVGGDANSLAAEYVNDPRAMLIAEAARRFNEVREAWLNPPDLVERVPEVLSGFPDHIVPVSPKAAAILKNVP